MSRLANSVADTLRMSSSRTAAIRLLAVEIAERAWVMYAALFVSAAPAASRAAPVAAAVMKWVCQGKSVGNGDWTKCLFSAFPHMSSDRVAKVFGLELT